MFDKAASGDTRAAQTVIKMVQNIERENKLRLEENLQIVSDYGGWHDYEEGIQAISRKPLKFFPNPKHISINAETGEIEIDGPINAEERKRLDEDVGSLTEPKYSIPKRVLARRKDFPKGSWKDELFLEKPMDGKQIVRLEVARTEQALQETSQPNLKPSIQEVEAGRASDASDTISGEKDVALDLLLRDASTRPTSELISKLRSQPQFK